MEPSGVGARDAKTNEAGVAVARLEPNSLPNGGLRGASFDVEGGVAERCNEFPIRG